MSLLHPESPAEDLDRRGGSGAVCPTRYSSPVKIVGPRKGGVKAIVVTAVCDLRHSAGLRAESPPLSFTVKTDFFFAVGGIYNSFRSRGRLMSKRKNGRDRSHDGFTRRSFLRGVGIAAGGTSVLSSGLLQAIDTPPNTVGPGPTPITLNINGTSKQVSIEPRATLAQVLRDQLGMTGTKIVCDRGSCSGCTVWLDGTPVNSCMTFAMDVGDRKITTIEGLGTPDHLHPVQAAFVEHDGMQCGYCTPGMVMSCAALVERNPDPTHKDVQQAISGNVCRCGTYPKVIEATLAAAKMRKGA